MQTSPTLKAHGRGRGLGLALAAAFLMNATTYAATVDFATFNQTASGSPFSFTNNGGVSGTINYNTAVQVNFNFTAATGLGTGDRLANVTITNTGGVSTFTPAASAGGFLVQPLNNLPTIKFTEVSTGKNLLTMTFTGDILGRVGAAVGSIQGDDTTGQVVQYTSDYIAFGAPGNSYVLSLGAISPGLSLGAGGFLNSFTANIGGQFRGSIPTIPEPTSIIMLGTGVALPLWALRRHRKQQTKA
ncbi:MAG: PEP-CTERM sorting domain-containing protein [Isosphaeraceae bacterium]